jgi:hypothetical protein
MTKPDLDPPDAQQGAAAEAATRRGRALSLTCNVAGESDTHSKPERAQ